VTAVGFDLDHWHEVFQSLRRNPLRTFLTACGVFWGVFMLVAMLGFGRGLETAVFANFGNWAPNAVFIWGDGTTIAYGGRQLGREIRFTPEDVEALERLDGVELVLPRNSLGGWRGGNVVTRKDKSESFGVSGETPDFLRLENLEIRQGRFLNPLDMAEHRKVAVIGSRVRDVLFDEGENPIGESIRVGNSSFVVAGVYHSPSASGGRTDWVNGRIFVARTTFSRAFATGNHVGHLSVLVSPSHPSSEVEEACVALLKARHQVHPDDPEGVDSWNRQKSFDKVNTLFIGISGLTWIVGILTLLAGAIGVSNIMMIAVAERTKEIGIRKAVGATPFSIIFQIVQESTVLTGLAGYLGLVAGVGALEIVAHIVDALPRERGPQFFTRPDLDLTKALVAAAVLTIAGGLAGLAPARSAVAIRPVEALAHE
jgi:putative ABC transport system permease protein